MVDKLPVRRAHFVLFGLNNIINILIHISVVYGQIISTLITYLFVSCQVHSCDLYYILYSSLALLCYNMLQFGSLSLF